MNASIAPSPVSIYQVDAFSNRLFAGNPAAVCPLQAWLPDDTLQAVAAENNLAETAYLCELDGGYELRWFTPTHEVRLCGHATLASAYVLWNCLGVSEESIRFETRHSGTLRVSRSGDWCWLDFPAQAMQPATVPEEITTAMNIQPAESLQGPNWLLRYNSESEIRSLEPDMRKLAALPDRCVIATAPADDPAIDFVSRFFAPNFGVNEDPVTGSAHCMLAPYWAAELNKPELEARQISARGGVLKCRMHGDRVHIGGQARLYLKGEIFIQAACFE